VLCSAVAIDAIRETVTVMAEPAIGGAQAAERKAKRQGYVWSATRSGSDIRLRGMVPSEDVRSTVLGMVKANFPDLEVEDRMRVAAGAPAVDQWLGAVSFGLQQLSHLKHGSVRLLNVGLRIDGEAGGAEDFAELQKSLGSALPTGLNVIANNVRPPRVEPFVFVASLSPDTLALTGSVPNERMRKRLRDLSRQLFERPTLDDRLELASGAPKNWNDAVIALLRALSRLESGKGLGHGTRGHHRRHRARQDHGRLHILPAPSRFAFDVLAVGKNHLERGEPHSLI
jgi:OOP family OmpA-OmpF porin